MNPFFIEAKFPDALFVRSASLFHHRDGLLDLSGILKVAEQNNGVSQITGVDRRLYVTADHPVLSNHHKCGHPMPAEIGQKLMEMSGEEPLLGHCVHVAVETIDNDDVCLVLFD